MTSDLLQIAGAACIGLLVGALLMEAVVLISYWKTLSADTFHELHATFGPRLFRFFAPLTILAPALAGVAALFSMLVNDPGRCYSVASACLVVAVMLTYPLYFKAANERIALPGKTDQELASELSIWAKWHWSRTLIGIVAFTLSLLAL